MDKKTVRTAQDYHSSPKPGKIEIVSTKPLMTQEDLSLAYTPGVANVCTDIAKDPAKANEYTTKGNLVAVITNGSAVLGLGNIGALASKPVMEGKAVLFKKFANIDVFDIEIDEADPDKFVDTVARLAPTFGGINLEDIKAPECFEIERKLRKSLDIPVLHDDQHGTAIIVTAAFINAMHIAKKKKENVKIVCVGAGAAGLACIRMLHHYGVKKENITLVDLDGVIYKGRKQMNPYIEEFAADTKMRTLDEAIVGADVFIGLSAKGVLKPTMVKKMAKAPIIFAMANPDPEIMPDEAKKAAPKAIVGTGRSDFPNQINNVLGFPYLFRGALDAGAKKINMAMKIAAAEALAQLTRKEADASLDVVYKGAKLKFGEDYIIPKPFDPRLLPAIASAVAQAAMDSGVATTPIKSMEKYIRDLTITVDKSFSIMRQIYATARKEKKKIVFPDSEDVRVLRASQTLINEGIARPILVGRPDVIRSRVKDIGLSMKDGKDYDLIDPAKNDKLDDYAEVYYDMRKREGLLPPEAEITLRARWAAFSSMMVRQGDADGMVTGLTGRFIKYWRAIEPIIGKREDVNGIYALQLLMHQGNFFFIGDTHLTHDPTAEQVAEMAWLAWHEVQHFGISPRIALLSHSHFGSSYSESAAKMRKAKDIINERWPEILVEGEMQADGALDMDILNRTFPDSSLKEPANILLMPSIDAANITFNMMRCMSEGNEYIGPILLGMKKPVHILSIDASVRRIVNMTALSVVEAQQGRED
jgi:malate dehydrogenase (oxaloacetate-decarboxylating)(NADP+)